MSTAPAINCSRWVGSPVGKRQPDSLEPVHEARQEQLEERRHALGGTVFAAAWQSGEVLAWQQAVRFALEEEEPDEGRSLPPLAPGTELSPDDPVLLPQD